MHVFPVVTIPAGATSYDIVLHIVDTGGNSRLLFIHYLCFLLHSFACLFICSLIL